MDRFTVTSNPPDDQSCSSSSSSATKLGTVYSLVRSHVTTNDKESEDKECYVLFNTDILKEFITSICKCPVCNSHIKLVHNIEHMVFVITFLQLALMKSLYGQKSEILAKKRDQKGRNFYDINLRAVIAFREIGKGNTGIETFCRCINMPPPMTNISYDNIVYSLLPCYKEAVNESMKKAADEAYVNTDDKQPDDDGNIVANATANFDGT